MAKTSRENLEFHMSQLIERRALIPENAGVLVAVSGGIDSMVLLHALLRISEQRRWRLVVGHVDHAIRGEISAADAAFVLDEAKRLGLSCKHVQLDAGLWEEKGNLESKARKLRYEWLERWADEMACDVIVTAHHADDQAETLLERLARGTGLDGLRGIELKRGRIVRPLLTVSRADIVRYAQEHQISWREDQTNSNLDKRRNLIRHNILPILEDMVTGATSHMANASVRLAEADEAIRSIARIELDQNTLSSSPTRIRIRLQNIDEKPVGLRTAIWREAARKLFGEALWHFTSEHWAMIDRMALSGHSGKESHLGHGLILTRGRDSIELEKNKAPETETGYEFLVEIPGKTRIPTGIIDSNYRENSQIPEETRAFEAVFDLSEISTDLIVRNWQKGDRMLLPSVGHRKVADLLSESGVPRSKRESWPVIASGKEILWIPGIRRSAHAYISENTGRILGIIYRKDLSN